LRSIPNPLDSAGNTAYAAKEYDTAIEHYSTAIRHDGSNHIYFSNRAACYAAKADWAASLADAQECVKLSPGFIKGYYRLVTACIELEKYEDAMFAVKAGLSLDKDNSELHKQMRLIKAKMQVKEGRKNGPAVPRERMNAKEALEIMDQLNAAKREMNETSQYLAKAQREQKMAELAKEQIQAVPEDKNMYRGVGKIFMKSTRAEVNKWMDDADAGYKKDEGKYKKKIDYLEKKAESLVINYKEVTSR
jgi:stress-induced-phosphoprotein 1